MGLLFFALCSIPAEGRRPGGKAAAKQGQLSHFAEYGSGRSVRPSR